jgi:hypothetical protein
MTEEIEKLKLLAKAALDAGIGVFNKSGPDVICPTWFVQNEEGDVFKAQTPFQNDLEKRVYALAIKESIKEFGIVRYALLTEGWSIIREKNDKREFEQPSKCPDRKEVLLVVAEDGETSMMLTCEIMRHENAAPSLNLDKIEETMNTVENTGGALTGLVPPKKPRVMQ